MRSVRMDIAAYVLLGIAGVVLAFAGLHGFQNKSITIISFGVGACLVIVSGCLYWQDAVWKNDARLNPPPNNASKFLDVPVIEPKRTSATPAVSPATASPSPPPTPSLTPAPSQSPTSTPTLEASPLRAKPLSQEPINFTPTEIMKKIDSGMFESQKEHMRKSFADPGLPVDWTLIFVSTSEVQKGTLTVYFRESPQSALPLVHISVPLEGNERLPLTETDKKFRVKGLINSVDRISIGLRNATFEPAP